MLLVRYKSEASLVQQVELSSVPLEGSLVVRPSAGDCSYTLERTTLTLNGNVPAGTVVSISWSYTENIGSFGLDGVTNPDDGSWTVDVNGLETRAFTRQGATITLNDTPSADAKVTVTFSHRDAKAE